MNKLFSSAAWVQIFIAMLAVLFVVLELIFKLPKQSVPILLYLSVLGIGAIFVDYAFFRIGEKYKNRLLACVAIILIFIEFFYFALYVNSASSAKTGLLFQLYNLFFATSGLLRIYAGVAAIRLRPFFGKIAGKLAKANMFLGIVFLLYTFLRIFLPSPLIIGIWSILSAIAAILALVFSVTFLFKASKIEQGGD